MPAHAQQNAQPDRNLLVERTAVAPATRSQRVALVIGNAAYKEAPLLNPVNDAKGMAKALQEAGFVVILRENADQRSMQSALREFGDKLKAGGTGLFYYAGHGMQIKGRNFLIPVGANVDREDEVAYSAVDAQAVLDKMEAAGNGTNIMILDACRNNPFTRSTRNGQAGLAQMDAPIGTLVAFATSPGMVASDGTGQNGLYTQHLLEALRKDGMKVEDVFKQVRANVRRDSQGKQVPWEATSLEGDFFFRGGANTGRIDTEQALWDAVKGSSQIIELRVYLNRYPTGRFAELAKTRIAQLQPALAPTAATTPPTVAAQAPVGTRPPAPTPSPSASIQSPAAKPNEDLQVALDKRTEELLAQLTASSAPVATQTSMGTRPALASSAAGYTVGDTWRFQTVDKFKRKWSVTGRDVLIRLTPITRFV
ncbi:MAG: caspase family protein [Brachymonas sp.]|nr:caspase family protein [Brachymonas sp.]